MRNFSGDYLKRRHLELIAYGKDFFPIVLGKTAFYYCLSFQIVFKTKNEAYVLQFQNLDTSTTPATSAVSTAARRDGNSDAAEAADANALTATATAATTTRCWWTRV